jgi:outer membrane beta-barrel protein
VFDQRHFTANVGFGVRAWLSNWASLQVDMRDHIFSLDILGQQRSTQNLEFTGGITLFF